MTSTLATHPPDIDILRSIARAGGLATVAYGSWPHSPADQQVEPLPGFIESTFSPLVAQTAHRALHGRPTTTATTAVILVTALGDLTSAVAVAGAVDAARRVGPLMFFQSVPNAVAGHLAARFGLRGPVVCVSRVQTAIEVAASLIEDGDADDALVVWAEVATDPEDRDRAAAALIRPADERVDGDRS